MQPLTRNPLTLLGGLLSGLAVGLLIGWVLWPVTWTNAQLADLHPTVRAEYLAAVADAYAVYNSPEAAAVAQQRLMGVGGDLASEFANAVNYYAESNLADKAIRVSNLSRLANALGLVPPGTLTSVTNGVTNGDPAATDSAPGMTGSRWFFTLLFFALLLAGGFYAWRRYGGRWNFLPSQDSFDQRVQRELDRVDRSGQLGPLGEVDEFEAEPALATQSTSLPAAQRALITSSRAQPAADDYQFPVNPTEVANEPRRVSAGLPSAFSSRPALPNLPAALPSEITARYTPLSQLDEDIDDDDDLNDDLTDEDEATEDSGDEAHDNLPRSPTLVRPGRTTDDEQADLEDDSEEDHEGAAGRVPSQPTFAPGALSRTQPAPAYPRSAKLSVLAQHTAHYQMGMRDYDEARQINAPRQNKYLGEFGMGASIKNALLHNNPDQVIALEVWLFDKSDEESLVNRTCVLLSEFAVDHNLEQAFVKERQGDIRAFTAQPGVNFQLKGNNLWLDARILEAVYLPNGPDKGIFQSVKLELSVYQKA